MASSSRVHTTVQENEPKHKIFISHSGAQKDFAEQLTVDLERVHHNPFFDKRDDSLRDGDEVSEPIFKAARECWVGVLVLSEEFFVRTKWPMIELVTFVERQRSNPKLRILPLYYRLPRQEVCSRRAVQRWMTTWIEWAKTDKRIIVNDWRHAVRVLHSIKGIEFAGPSMGEVAYRRRIVSAICKLAPPDHLHFDVCHVQGRERLCKVILNHLQNQNENSGERPCPRVGVYGMAGMGKTTLCKCFCNHFTTEFHGKVCHIELSSNQTPLDRQKRMLKILTELDESTLRDMTDVDQAMRLLKIRLHRFDVFIALDNVDNTSISWKEASTYLSMLNRRSLVIVTARSRDVLTGKLDLSKENCVPIPGLDSVEAINLFLHEVAPGSKPHFETFTYKEQDFVRQCIAKGKFRAKLSSGPSQYHPLALRALAGQLGSAISDPSSWEERLHMVDLKRTDDEDEGHPIFKVLRTSYDTLPPDSVHKLIFMDLTLGYKPHGLESVEENCRWLSHVYNVSPNYILDHLEVLKGKTLIDYEHKPASYETGFDLSRWNSQTEFWKYREPPQLHLDIHDLYCEFARWEARRQRPRQCLVHCSVPSCQSNYSSLRHNCEDVPEEFVSSPDNICWPIKRMALTCAKFKLAESELGVEFRNMLVLKLDSIQHLEELDLAHVERLRSLSILHCANLKIVRGFRYLKHLLWLQLMQCRNIEELPDLNSSRNLRILHLDSLPLKTPLDLDNCIDLSELVLTNLPRNPLVFGRNLVKIHIRHCKVFEFSVTFESVAKLQDFYYQGEFKIIKGLSQATSLSKLEICYLNLERGGSRYQVQKDRSFGEQKALCRIADALSKGVENSVVEHVMRFLFSWTREGRPPLDLPDSLKMLQAAHVLVNDIFNPSEATCLDQVFMTTEFAAYQIVQRTFQYVLERFSLFARYVYDICIIPIEDRTILESLLLAIGVERVWIKSNLEVLLTLLPERSHLSERGIFQRWIDIPRRLTHIEALNIAAEDAHLALEICRYGAFDALEDLLEDGFYLFFCRGLILSTLQKLEPAQCSVNGSPHLRNHRLHTSAGGLDRVIENSRAAGSENDPGIRHSLAIATFTFPQYGGVGGEVQAWS